MSLVSIVIPAYNVEKYLNRCLDSIINQTYKKIEILLVNDGSTDYTANICDEYKAKDNRIRVFHNDNQGVSSARNFSIDNSTGKYLLFIDADDYVELNYVETLVKHIEKEDVDLVICGIKDLFNGEGIIRKPRGKITGNFKKDYFGIIDFLCGPVSKIYKNSIVKEKGIRFLQDLNYAEDEIFNLNYYQYIRTYKFVDNPLYFYEHHKNSLSDKDSLRDKSKLNDYIRKLRMQRELLELMDVHKKEQILGEQGIRAVLYMTDLSSYTEFVKEVNIIRRNLYMNYKYDKIYKTIFAVLLNLEIYMPLYYGCKLRNFLRNV